VFLNIVERFVDRVPNTTHPAAFLQPIYSDRFVLRKPTQEKN
jgi:hypothetical protein